MRSIHLLVVALLILLTPPFAVTGSQSESGTAYIYTSTAVIKNLGESELALNESYRTFSLLMNTSWQTAYLQRSSGSYRIVNDYDGNLNIVLDTSSIPKGGNVTFSTSLKILAKQRNPPQHKCLCFRQPERYSQRLAEVCQWNGNLAYR